MHGFTDTWRTWELVLPALERRHDVLAPTLARPRRRAAARRRRSTARTLADAVERAMDEAGFATAHIAGNSLGGYVALQLAARGRAALGRRARAGRRLGARRRRRSARRSSTSSPSASRCRRPRRTPRRSSPRPRAAARRRCSFATNFEHIPAELLAHEIRGVAGCDGARAMIEYALARGLRARRREDRLPGADRVGHRATSCCRGPRPPRATAATGCRTPTGSSSTGVGHCPQLDVPLETAQLILGFTAGLTPEKHVGPPQGGPTTIGYSLVFTRGDCRVFRGSPTPGLSASSLSGSGERHP